MENAGNRKERNELVEKSSKAREEGVARKHELVIYRDAPGAGLHKDMETYHSVPVKKEYRRL